MAEQILSEVKVLDLSWHVAGPYCTKLLSDYGAEVIKIEKPGEGDPARKMGPFYQEDPHPEKSGLFLHLNTNKKSITLNLKSEWGKKVVKDLVKETDILVESFSPGVMENLGIGYETLEKINPKLVMTSITNFGQTGPYKDHKLSELVLASMGSAMNETGMPDRYPLKKAGNICQYQGGAHAALASLLGYYTVKKESPGQHIDVALFETEMGSIDRRMANLISYQWNCGTTPRKGGAPSKMFPSLFNVCKDGYFEVIGGPAFWPRICNMIGHPELISDPRFCTFEGQAEDKNRETFEREYWYPWTMEHTRDEIMEAGQKHRNIIGTVNTTEDLLASPHLKERGYWAEIEHPVTGNLTYPGSPAKLDKGPWLLKLPAPLLGQHNEEVYGKLGYTKDDMVKLMERNII